MNTAIRFLHLLSFALLVFGGEVLAENDLFREHPIVMDADSLANIWQWERAARNYEKAKVIFYRESNLEGFIYCLGNLGHCKMQSGHYEEAFLTLSQTLDKGVELLGPDAVEVARIYFFLGYYYFMDEVFDQQLSLDYCQRALEIRQDRLPADHLDLADSYDLLGRYFRKIEKFAQARSYHEKALEIYEKNLKPAALRIGRSYRILGMCLRDLHFPVKGQAYSRQALRIFQLHPEISNKELSFAFENVGTSFFDNEDFDQARQYYEQAIILMDEHYGPNSVESVVAINNLASSFGYLGNFERASDLFQRSIRINSGSGNKNYEFLSWTYEQYADVLDHSGHLDWAIANAKKAIAAIDFLSYDVRIQRSSINESLANYYLKKEAFDSSLFYVQASLTALDYSFLPEGYLANPNISGADFPDFLYKALSTKGRILNQFYEHTGEYRVLVSALNLYMRLDSLADNFRNELYTEASKLLLSKYYKEDAAGALAILSTLNVLENQTEYASLALKFMEKNRYARIYGNQFKVREISRAGVPDSLYELEVGLAAQMETLRYDLSEVKDPGRRKEIELEMFKLTLVHESFQKEIRLNYPSYYRINYEKMLSLVEIQQRLPARSQIIEFFWTDSTLYAVCIAKNESSFHRIKLDRTLLEILQSFQIAIARDFNPDEDMRKMTYTQYVTLAFPLYSRLLQPLLINGKKNLILSPDGPLFYLPFEALVTSPERESWRKAPYILTQYNCQYTYSANLLFGSETLSLQEKPSILALAYTDPAKILIDTAGYEYQDSLNEIIGSSLEIDAIKALFDDQVTSLKGVDASESAFIENAEASNIIHLAVHGKGDRSNELNSTLYFKSEDRSEKDGKLLAHELYDLDLRNVRLTVLSACESGVGKEVQGAGIFSVARGFAYAGCPSAVMSLWNVNDMRTAELMKLFYTFLKKGYPVSEALGLAKLKFIEEAYYDNTANPYYWAGFIHTGISAPVCRSSNVWLFAIPGLILFVLVALFGRKYLFPQL